MLWRQPALISRALGIAPPLRKHADRIRQMEDEIYTFASRHRRALPALAAAELGFHVLGVAEIYLTLWLLNVSAAHAPHRVPVRNRESPHHGRLQVRPAPARRG